MSNKSLHSFSRFSGGTTESVGSSNYFSSTEMTNGGPAYYPDPTTASAMNMTMPAPFQYDFSTYPPPPALGGYMQPLPYHNFSPYANNQGFGGASFMNQSHIEELSAD